MDILDEKKRKENEKKFGTWEELRDGGRRYSYNPCSPVSHQNSQF